MTPPPNPQPESSTPVVISPTSDRLQVLEPFSRFTGSEFMNLRVLVKVKGKCTTDHISAAGKWLKYKGHLENIANNTLIGAMNAETDEVNVVYDYEGAGTGVSIPDLGRRWKSRGQDWIVVAEVHLQSPQTVLMAAQLRGGISAGARKFTSPLFRWPNRPREIIRPNPRDESQKARCPTTDLCERRRLRSHQCMR
jgi:Aconitase C-terminal domain